MKLLISRDDLYVGIAPEVADIPQFASLVDRDASDEKAIARRELAWVYHTRAWDSPFKHHHQESRADEVKRRFFGEDSDWEPDEAVLEAADAYEEMTRTPATETLSAAIDALHEMNASLRTTTTDSPRDMKDLIMAIEKLPGAIDSLQEMYERVRREQAGGGRIRGGFTPNSFNT